MTNVYYYFLIADEIGCVTDYPQVLGLEVLGDNVNATSVKVDWYIPRMSQAHEYLYQPTFAPEGTDDWTYIEWQKRPDLTYTFTDLRPFTTYKFKVNLKTPNGSIYNSTSMTKTTTTPAMPSKPKILSLDQTSQGLVLKWTKPATTNGPLKHYIIEMTKHDSQEKPSILETDGPVQEYTFDTQQFQPGQK